MLPLISPWSASSTWSIDWLSPSGDRAPALLLLLRRRQQFQVVDHGIIVEFSALDRLHLNGLFHLAELVEGEFADRRLERILPDGIANRLAFEAAGFLHCLDRHRQSAVA